MDWVKAMASTKHRKNDESGEYKSLNPYYGRAFAQVFHKAKHSPPAGASGISAADKTGTVTHQKDPHLEPDSKSVSLVTVE